MPSERPRAGRVTTVPIRNLIALWTAALAAFFLGLVEAIERLPYGPTMRLGAIGLVIALLAGLAGLLHGRGRIGARVLVTLIRTGLSGAVFVFVFEGMRLLLKIGDVGPAVASWVWAGILGILLARLAPVQAPTTPGTERRTPSPPAGVDSDAGARSGG